VSETPRTTRHDVDLATPSLSQTTGRPGPQRRRGARRAWLISGSLVMLGLAIAAGVLAGGSHGPAQPSGCTFGADSGPGRYTITPEQAQNAAIIAAVALRRALPDHAVTVALATSFQESELRDLRYGDLDSVGLFQQRPSQGWGTVAQILDPNYAATAFFDHLNQIAGWQTMPVTEAAQLVQHSASPDAYAAWETESRSLARALTGEVPAGLSCTLSGFGGPAPASSALRQAITTEMGAQLLQVPVPSKIGWQVAVWAVAHAYLYHLSSVSFGGRTWTMASGTWGATSPGVTTSQMVVVAA
jgi:hypothetical protein